MSVTGQEINPPEKTGTHTVPPAQPLQPEPHWPAMTALFVAAVLYAVLPDALSAGPRWLLLAIVTVLSIPNLITHRAGNHLLNSVFGYLTETVMTVFLLWSVFMLVKGLPQREVSPGTLLCAAALLWPCNVVLFALWYWRLDAGGPHARHKRGQHVQGAFLFPPMTNDGRRATPGQWVPTFVDYLFLSFTTSTALSPTDTPVISRWAKVLVIIQSIISLTVIVVLAARAVNLL